MPHESTLLFEQNGYRRCYCATMMATQATAIKWAQLVWHRQHDNKSKLQAMCEHNAGTHDTSRDANARENSK